MAGIVPSSAAAICLFYQLACSLALKFTKLSLKLFEPWTSTEGVGVRVPGRRVPRPLPARSLSLVPIRLSLHIQDGGWMRHEWRYPCWCQPKAPALLSEVSFPPYLAPSIHSPSFALTNGQHWGCRVNDRHVAPMRMSHRVETRHEEQSQIAPRNRFQ